MTHELWSIGGLLPIGLTVALLLTMSVSATAYGILRREGRQRRAAEIELADQLQLQRAIMEATPYPLVAKDPQFRYTAVNRAYEEMNGVKREDVLGKTMLELGFYRDIEQVEYLWNLGREAMERPEGVHTEMRFEDARGLTHDLLYSVVPFRRSDGSLGGSVTTSVDISDIRTAQQRAHISEKRLRDITAALPVAVFQFRVEANGRCWFPYVGGKPEDIFGISTETIMADEPAAFARVAPEDQPRLRAAIAHTVETLEPLQLEVHTPEGEAARCVRFIGGEPLRMGDGAVQWSGYWVDVTREREQADTLARAKEAAETATRAKTDFLAVMSHEIRTPMNGIVGTLELLGRTGMDGAQQRLLQAADTSAQWLLHIIDDILDFSKIEAGRMSIEALPSNLRELTDSVIDVMARQLADKGLDLRINVDPALAGVHLVDEGRLRQILLNLLGNALKFTLHGGVDLDVSVLADTHHVQTIQLRVRDTGIGISPAQQARLFEPFQQADTSIQNRFGGTGLGLAICKSLTELMQGSIHLVSTPGAGTEVSVVLTLPVYRRSAAVADLTGHAACIFPNEQAAPRTLREALVTLGLRLIDAQSPAAQGDGCLWFVAEQWIDTCRGADRCACIAFTEAALATGLHSDGTGLRLSTRPLSWRALITACRTTRRHVLESAQEPSAPAAPSRDAALALGRLLLVAEDHPIGREIIRQQLNALGYACDTVADGLEAYEALRGTHYAMLITDCHMPRIDGFELARRVRRDEQGSARHLPVIALTAGVLPEQRRACLEAGMDDYMAKPLRLEGLRTALQRWLPLDRTGNAERATPAPQTPPAPLDLSLLRESFDGEHAIGAMLRVLVATTRADLDGLEAAFTDTAPRAVARWVHRVVGGISMLRPAELMVQGQMLEHRCTAFDAHTLRSELETFRHDVEIFVEHVERALEEVDEVGESGDSA